MQKLDDVARTSRGDAAENEGADAGADNGSRQADDEGLERERQISEPRLAQKAGEKRDGDAIRDEGNGEGIVAGVEQARNEGAGHCVERAAKNADENGAKGVAVDGQPRDHDEKAAENVQAHAEGGEGQAHGVFSFIHTAHHPSQEQV